MIVHNCALNASLLDYLLRLLDIVPRVVRMSQIPHVFRTHGIWRLAYVGATSRQASFLPSFLLSLSSSPSLPPSAFESHANIGEGKEEEEEEEEEEILCHRKSLRNATGSKQQLWPNRTHSRRTNERTNEQ